MPDDTDTPRESVTDATFETEVLESDKPIVVDFWADWCGPCNAARPTVDALASEYDESLRVVHLDVDANPQTPSHYGITSIPTFLRFVDGEVVARVVGAVARPRLEELFEG